MTPSQTFQAHAKHLERVAAWLYQRAGFYNTVPVTSRGDVVPDATVALDSFIVADTLDNLARDLREYATLYAGRIP